jgi:hypothetical protein
MFPTSECVYFLTQQEHEVLSSWKLLKHLGTLQINISSDELQCVSHRNDYVSAECTRILKETTSSSYCNIK